MSCGLTDLCEVSPHFCIRRQNHENATRAVLNLDDDDDDDEDDDEDDEATLTVVVVEDCRHVRDRKHSSTEAQPHARLANIAVADYDTLDRFRSRPHFHDHITKTHTWRLRRVYNCIPMIQSLHSCWRTVSCLRSISRLESRRQCDGYVTPHSDGAPYIPAAGQHSTCHQRLRAQLVQASKLTRSH